MAKNGGCKEFCTSVLLLSHCITVYWTYTVSLTRCVLFRLSVGQKPTGIRVIPLEMMLSSLMTFPWSQTKIHSLLCQFEEEDEGLEAEGLEAKALVQEEEQEVNTHPHCSYFLMRTCTDFCVTVSK